MPPPATLMSRATAPVIETERLRLRGHSVADFAGFANLCGDAEVARFIGGQPIAPEEAWAKLLRSAGLWPLLGFGYWVIEERATGRFAGTVGFGDFKRALEPSFDGLPEIGWVLGPTAQGKGYATEAAQAALAWGDTHFQADRTVCLIAPENLPSLRVAAKLGYREYARTAYKEKPVVLLSRERDGIA